MLKLIWDTSSSGELHSIRQDELSLLLLLSPFTSGVNKDIAPRNILDKETSPDFNYPMGN